MTGFGLSHGAVSLVNGIICGIGSTVGVGLRTEARFAVGGKTRKVNISNDPLEDTSMAMVCVSEAHAALGREEPFGWALDVTSQIPISRGLKSSSSACNAIIMAVFDHLGHIADPLDVVTLGVRCARRAGVTVTGAFDDACGCHLGGIIVTDNSTDTIVSHTPLGEFEVVIKVPDVKIRNDGLPLGTLKSEKGLARGCADMAAMDPFNAMTVNGKIVSKALGFDDSWADTALEYGALGAGVSGTGPAIAAVFRIGESGRFIKNHGDSCIITSTRDAAVIYSTGSRGKETWK